LKPLKGDASEGESKFYLMHIRFGHPGPALWWEEGFRSVTPDITKAGVFQKDVLNGFLYKDRPDLVVVPVDVAHRHTNTVVLDMSALLTETEAWMQESLEASGPAQSSKPSSI
jgi:hypothetical protein